ncbi:hypothetical protein Tco_1062183, partial [Tanacetum coccineum]
DILKMEMEIEMEILSVKASANSDVKYSFTSAQDGEPLQDDVRLCLGNDLKKAQDHSQRHKINQKISTPNIQDIKCPRANDGSNKVWHFQGDLP